MNRRKFFTGLLAAPTVAVAAIALPASASDEPPMYIIDPTGDRRILAIREKVNGEEIYWAIRPDYSYLKGTWVRPES